MKWILCALFLVASSAYAVPMTLEWDPVTTNVDGSPSGAVIYHLYKKSPTGPYLLLASRIATRYTWQVPQIGTWTFMVRAASKLGESADSNTVQAQVDPCWVEIK